MEDIPLLLEKTLNELQVENGMKKRLSADALDLLQKYSWPGNIRELNNIITNYIICLTAMRSPHFKFRGI